MFGWSKRAPQELSFEQIAKKLRKVRRATVNVSPLNEEERAKVAQGEGQLRDLVGDYIRQFRYYRYDPSHWESLTRPAAERLLGHLIYKDMAYQSPFMERAEAEGYAKAFLDQFRPEATFLSIGYHTSEWDDVQEGWYAEYQYAGISQASFDCGVIAVDAERIGILWVEDED